jgi:uncharacterized repeat protein (TIGR02543 family)
VKDQLTSWEKTLSAYTSDYEIALAAHDLINNKVVYDDDIYDDGYDEDNRYSQSAYSALCTDLTVCAGYTLAYEMIMNAMGIDCIGVTSDEHAWNKVILEDNWYNVDCTWDDTGGKYFYFARNDVNIKGDGYHNPTGMWVYYLPTCTLDTYSGYDAVGELPNISSLTKTPQVHVTKGTKGYNVIIESDTPDAEIYYTTDGTEPSCAKTRCELYYTGFTVAEGTVVRAIAVADQRLNSQETKIQVTAASIDETANDTKKGTDTQQHGSDNNLQTPGESQISDDETGTQVPGNSNETPQQTYQITYYLDGGTNSEENPSSYDSTQTVALKAPMKTGYTFEGWYILSDYTAEVDEIIQGTAGNITLFAKWVPHQYKILFKGNGSTSGSMAKLSCKYGKSYQLTANKFKRTGYTFIGWNTKANGKGTFYKNKAGIKNLTTESDKKIVLYAQWKKK